jgi:hypothetical protein
MKCQWNKEGTELSFETNEIRGILVADSSAQDAHNFRHRIKEVIHKPTGTRVTPEDAPMVEKAGSFNLFRVYARNSLLTELRATKPTVIKKNNDGVKLTWEPTFQHQVKTSVIFTIREPNIIDADISIEGHCYYPDYELLFTNYVAPQLKGGVYVKKNDFKDTEVEQITVTDNPVFHGMYTFFPKNEHAAHIMTDGRGQRGRWYWRVAGGRLYAYPMGYASNKIIDVILIGRPEDVSAVGVTYSADGENYDNVAQHHALYFSLFGRDLHPGEGWRTQVRLVIDGNVSDQKHTKYYNSFLQKVSTIKRCIQISPA